MMASIDSCIRRGRGRLRQWALDPRTRQAGRIVLFFSWGMVLSAAGLAGNPQPLALGAVFTLTGWPAAVCALGGCAGYWIFWGKAAVQSLLWMGVGLPAALFLGPRKMTDEVPLLMPALAGMIVCACGLGFQIFLEDTTGVGIYLTRAVLAAGSSRVFAMVRDRQDPVADWMAAAMTVLGLARIVLPGNFSLGFVAAGMLASGSAFPAAALAGLALDLARITPTPMTAVLCLAYLTRMIPGGVRWLRFAAPGAVYLLVMGLCGVMDPLPAVALALGGSLGVLLPPQPELPHRRGETGLAQVRLELMAGVMAETQQILIEQPQEPVDEAALLARTRERACGSCPCRKACTVREIPPQLLHRPLVEQSSLSLPCRKPGRMILELRRSQEQLRTIRADRDRQKEYRGALVQQYQFLARYLRQLSDQLADRKGRTEGRYRTEAYLASSGKEAANGDRCLWFPGTEGRYYVLLCDGMGTGLGAAREGQYAAGILRRLLGAGFPAEYALRSLNSLLALQGKAGAVTADLAEIRQDTGRAVLYKWGAAPSWLLRNGGAEKIGTAGPPPGLSLTEGREEVNRLSLDRGEVLILLSDGVDGEAVLRYLSQAPEDPPGEMAEKLLELGNRDGQDDATAVVIRLVPGAMST